jgi:hypothetical protein
MVGGFAGEAVAVLRQHDGDAPARHEVPHPVYAGPLKTRPALACVLFLFEDLVTMTGGIFS